jgi:hypothetical protein
MARFQCHVCRRSFSSARYSPCFRQKRRKLNALIYKLKVSGVSERRIALLLRASRLTIVRKTRFLSEQARTRNNRFLDRIAAHEGTRFTDLQFDEMESFERSKCLPVSIPLVVDAHSRKILGARVCSMPAKGLLAALSRKKYGLRSDDRKKTAKKLLKSLSAVVAPGASWTTDENPKYPAWLQSQFPDAKHLRVKGRRGCVVGQGELKRGGFDPLFALNHSCAMIRANVNRLFRRTWCTTKHRDRLEDHLALYIDYHNRILVSRGTAG